MKSLKFLRTGEIRRLESDITLFSNIYHKLPTRNCQTIVLQDIERKHCVIIKDEHVLKIMDLASFRTRLCIKDEETAVNLVPFKFYELRPYDKVFIGDHEILISPESLYVPETQSEDYVIKEPSTLSDEHVEIPETQVEDLKETQIDQDTAGDVEFTDETQPVFNIIPRFTRAQTSRIDKIKPKAVPLANFDVNTMAFNVETQAISYNKTAEKPKPKVEKKTYNKRKMNSILLSEDELSDTDDERSTKSTVINGIILTRKSLEDDNSLNISINDEFDIPSQIIDSQFLEKVNESSSENYSLNLNSDFKEEKVEIKHEESVTKEEEEDFDDIFKPRPRKRFKLFKYNYSDDDDD